MPVLTPLPEWPAGRKHISVKEVAQLAAQWRYGPCADPPPPLAIDTSQCDFETMKQIYAMDHQARENHESLCRRRDVEIVTFEREILALASQLGVRLRRPDQTLIDKSFPKPTITVAELKIFLKEHGPAVQKVLWSAAIDRYSDKHIPRSRFLEAMDKLKWRRGRTGRPRQAPKQSASS